MKRLRYTGPNRTTFVDYGELGPGEEFEVPDEKAEAFLNHGYIEEVLPAKASKAKVDRGSDSPDAEITK